MPCLANSLIDSHCHLDHFSQEEIPTLLTQAREAGVGGLITIGTRLSRATEQKALSHYNQPDLRIWCTVGTHPNHVEEETLLDVEQIVTLAQEAKAIGIGETGLDYFYGAEPTRAKQQESFRRHIHAARLLNIPVIIHARQADDDVAQILEQEYANAPFAMLLHCFASTPELAYRVVAIGGYVSFSGIATFPKSHEIRSVVRALPIDRILVETDAPYLAPVPKRGKTNEPAFVSYIAARLAEELNMDQTRFAQLSTDNFFRLFSKAV
ncbi:MAG: TatD family hydrolase [Acetobacter sp.]|nr:TatD family hydrolase [Acetobacter sp.]